MGAFIYFLFERNLLNFVLLIYIYNCIYFSLIGGSDYKLIYRHYATLYFVFCVDSSESELGILDLIQVSFYNLLFMNIMLSDILPNVIDNNSM